MMRIGIGLLLAAAIAGTSALQTLRRAEQPFHDGRASISYDRGNGIFRMHGGAASYVMGVNTSGELQPIYWGPEIARPDAFAKPMPVGRAFDTTDTPQEFAGWGGGLLSEPSLKLTFPDETEIWFCTMSPTQLRATRLRYARPSMSICGTASTRTPVFSHARPRSRTTRRHP